MAAIVLALTLIGSFWRPIEVGTRSEFPNGPIDAVVVRIYSGMTIQREKGSSLGGAVPAITLLDEFGDLWGRSDIRKTIQEGDHIDVSIPASRTNRRATYITLSASGKNDAICMAGISIRQPDDHLDVISADFPIKCNYTGYPSNTPIGSVTPAKCFWIDGDYTVGTFPQAVSFHIKDFEPTKERADQYNQIPNALCKSEPRMHPHHEFNSKSAIRIYDPPLKYADGKVDHNYEVLWNKKWAWSWPKKGSRVRRMTVDTMGAVSKYFNRLFARTPPPQSLQDRFAGIIVKSNSTRHSAQATCADEINRGPDFVSLQEKLFCDMTSRVTYPVCEKGFKGECFDLERNTLRGALTGLAGPVGSPSGINDVMAVVPAGFPLKTYREVKEWV